MVSQAPAIANLSYQWLKIAGGTSESPDPRIPQRRELNLVHLRKHSALCSLLEYKGDHFEIRLSGTTVDHYWGSSLTGKKLADFQSEREQIDAFALYTDLLNQPCGLRTVTVFPTEEGTEIRQEKLTLPLQNREEKMIFLMSAYQFSTDSPLAKYHKIKHGGETRLELFELLDLGWGIPDSEAVDRYKQNAISGF